MFALGQKRTHALQPSLAEERYLLWGSVVQIPDVTFRVPFEYLSNTINVCPHLARNY